MFSQIIFVDIKIFSLRVSEIAHLSGWILDIFTFSPLYSLFCCATVIKFIKDLGLWNKVYLLNIKQFIIKLM